MAQLTCDHQNSSLIKNCIFTALMMLMETKDFEDITITEIAKKAGVSRMTYYRTYSSKEDILIQYFDEMSEKLIHAIKEQPELTPYDIYVAFFTFFKENTSLVENIVKANLLQLVLDHFIQFSEYLFQNIIKPDIHDMEIKYRIHYHMGGLLSLTHCWLENGKKESPEEMAAFAISIPK